MLIDLRVQLIRRIDDFFVKRLVKEGDVWLRVKGDIRAGEVPIGFLIGFRHCLVGAMIPREHLCRYLLAIVIAGAVAEARVLTMSTHLRSG